MNTENTYIVGDKFVEFAKHKNVMTIDSMSRYISQIDKTEQSGNIHNLIIGQGVNLNQVESLQDIIKKKKLKNIRFLNRQLLATRENKMYVHKHLDENVLITIPSFIDVLNNVYQSALILDERCAEMSDHVTGQHLQGMLLTEAARQMMTAVTERYLLSNQDRFNFYFALSKIAPTFTKFAFPIEVSILYKQIKLDIVPSRCLKSTAQISFTQKNHELCTVNIEMLALSKDVLKKIEEMEAIKLLNPANLEVYA